MNAPPSPAGPSISKKRSASPTLTDSSADTKKRGKPDSLEVPIKGTAKKRKSTDDDSGTNKKQKIVPVPNGMDRSPLTSFLY